MKRIRKIMTLSAFLFVMLAAAMLNARNTQAAEKRSSVKFTEKKMISKTSDSMTIQWAVFPDNAEVISFSVSYRERYSPSEDYIPVISGLSPETTKYTITGLKPGTLYFVRIAAK